MIINKKDQTCGHMVGIAGNSEIRMAINPKQILYSLTENDTQLSSYGPKIQCEMNVKPYVLCAI